MADAWWAVFILFLKNMFSWYTLVDIITSPLLEKQFEERKIELQKTGEFEQRLMFHRSPRKNYESIAKGGFVLDDVRNGRVHGDGVY